MKKKIASLVFTFASIMIAFAADDTYLYFLVEGYGIQTEDRNFDYAVVGVAKNSGSGWDLNWNGGEQTYLMVGANPGAASASDTPIQVSTSTGWYSISGPAWGNVSPYAGSEYAFYVETYMQNGDQVWGYNPKDLASYDALLAQGHIYDNTTALGNITPWIVPEPTSGILLLLGFAALALNRKR